MTSLVQSAYHAHLGGARNESAARQSGAKGFTAMLRAALGAWSQRMARQRADARLLAAAMEDPRVMADLQRAVDEADPALAASARASIARYQGRYSHYLRDARTGLLSQSW